MNVSIALTGAASRTNAIHVPSNRVAGAPHEVTLQPARRFDLYVPDIHIPCCQPSHGMDAAKPLISYGSDCSALAAVVVKISRLADQENRIRSSTHKSQMEDHAHKDCDASTASFPAVSGPYLQPEGISDSGPFLSAGTAWNWGVRMFGNHVPERPYHCSD